MNFEQRWRRATRWTEFGLHLKKKMSHWHDDALIKIDRISWILSPESGSDPSSSDGDVSSVPKDSPLLWVSKENDPENWHVQVTQFKCFFKQNGA